MLATPNPAKKFVLTWSKVIVLLESSRPIIIPAWNLWPASSPEPSLQRLCPKSNEVVLKPFVVILELPIHNCDPPVALYAFPVVPNVVQSLNQRTVVSKYFVS